MSRSSYTASERRGVLIIAILALLIIGAGLGLSHCNRHNSGSNDIYVVEEHPEMIDSVTVQKNAKNKTRKKTTTKSKKTKKIKSYRRRSPLDEPV